MAKSLKLSMIGIVKRFGGVVALDSVDFELRRGEVMALVGDNGAGKSTLIKTLAGAHTPDEGVMKLDDEEVRIHLTSGRLAKGRRHDLSGTGTGR